MEEELCSHKNVPLCLARWEENEREIVTNLIMHHLATATDIRAGHADIYIFYTFEGGYLDSEL